MKVIIFGEKIEKELARPGFELMTFVLEHEGANHYTMDSFDICVNFSLYLIHIMITFVPCNIFEQICYGKFILT